MVATLCAAPLRLWPWATSWLIRRELPRSNGLILHLPPCIGVAVNWVQEGEPASGSLVRAPVPEIGDRFTARGYGAEEDRVFGALAWLEWDGPDPTRGHYRACVTHNGCWWAVDDHMAVRLQPDGRPWRPALVLFLLDLVDAPPCSRKRNAALVEAAHAAAVDGPAAGPSVKRAARSQADLLGWLRPAAACTP